MVRRLRLVLLSTVLAGGCGGGGAGAGDDGAQVLHALAATLTADRKSVCVDSETVGDPLTIYRTMMALPATERPVLNWHQPAPLRPPVEPSGKRVFDGELRSDQIFLRLPAQTTAVLAPDQQRALDGAAKRLALATDNHARTVTPWSGAPLVEPHWWGFNRLNRACSPRYAFSHPVVAKDFAFVSVTAGHWGTIYAFSKQPGGWTTVGQWSNWLY
ncbi:MAG: hypothetical protein QM676_00460 [Novosphingobium sp.]